MLITDKVNNNNRMVSCNSPLDYFTGCCSIEGLVAADGGGSVVVITTNTYQCACEGFYSPSLIILRMHLSVFSSEVTSADDYNETVAIHRYYLFSLDRGDNGRFNIPNGPVLLLELILYETVVFGV